MFYIMSHLPQTLRSSLLLLLQFLILSSGMFSGEIVGRFRDYRYHTTGGIVIFYSKSGPKLMGTYVVHIHANRTLIYLKLK